MWINNKTKKEFDEWYAKKKEDGKKAKHKGEYKLEDNEEWVQTGHGYYAREKKKKSK